MIPFNNLRPIHDQVRALLGDAFESALDASDFIRGGALKAFERRFASFCGVDHCVGVGSGTDAVHLALRALGVARGDEVITVANSAEGTVCGISHAGGTPVYVDVGDDGLMDVAAAREAVTDRTKAILPVALYGRAPDMKALHDAFDGEVPIVLDACQAHGTTYMGDPIGKWAAAVACWSFYPTKNLGALGDGGAVTTNSPIVAEVIRNYGDYGRTSRDDQLTVGVNSRLDTVQAALLRVKLDRLAGWNRERGLIVALYRELLAGVPGIRLLDPVEGENYHLFAVRTGVACRDQLQRYLGHRGIIAFPHYRIPAYRQRATIPIDQGPEDFPETEKWCGQVLSLPLWVGIEADSVRKVADAVKSFVPDAGDRR